MVGGDILEKPSYLARFRQCQKLDRKQNSTHVTSKGHDYFWQYAAGLLTVGGTKVAQGSDRIAHCLNRVFYKELEEGACKIVDVNIILLA